MEVPPTIPRWDMFSVFNGETFSFGGTPLWNTSSLGHFKMLYWAITRQCTPLRRSIFSRALKVAVSAQSFVARVHSAAGTRILTTRWFGTQWLNCVLLSPNRVDPKKCRFQSVDSATAGNHLKPFPPSVLVSTAGWTCNGRCVLTIIVVREANQRTMQSTVHNFLALLTSLAQKKLSREHTRSPLASGCRMGIPIVANV